MKRVIVVGSAGQDGSYLFDRLIEEKAAFILGLTRAGVRAHGLAEGLCPGGVDILSPHAVHQLVATAEPDEVYYLAAHHHSAEDQGSSGSATLFQRSYEAHVAGLVHFLDALARVGSGAKLFYAASSHVFGDAASSPQDEGTPFSPRSAYAITKVAGIECCRLYRRAHGVRASTGILYNHESPRRRADFLTRKIARAAVAISRGLQSETVLGDLSARVDWGFAPDFVDAMVRITAQPIADDYVVATGVTHSVQDLAATAFELVGLDWRAHVREDASLIAKRRTATPLVGDAAKLRTATGWKPAVTFREMVHTLVRAELDA